MEEVYTEDKPEEDDETEFKRKMRNVWNID